MIFGAHVIIYSKDAEADRAFLRDILGFSCVEAGHNWLIFALPPAEVAIHPGDRNDLQEIYFMSNDLQDDIATLRARKVSCSEVQQARWGSIATLSLPGGGKIGLYQPNHPIAIATTST